MGLDGTACSKTGQEGSRLQALDVDEGCRGWCPGFSARFLTPRRAAQELAQLGSGSRREKNIPLSVLAA